MGLRGQNGSLMSYKGVARSQNIKASPEESGASRGPSAAVGTEGWGTRRPDSNPSCPFTFKKGCGHSLPASPDVHGSCWSPKLSQRPDSLRRAEPGQKGEGLGIKQLPALGQEKQLPARRVPW